MSLREYLSQIRVWVAVIVCLFAMSSWIDINGVFVELPLLVEVLPEGWDLPSYMTIIIQVANVGPLVYTVANRWAPDKVTEWPVVYVIIAIGGTASLLLAFLWERTTYTNGAERSTALLSLMAFLAVVDCTSSVVYLPYMALFKAQYTIFFFLGEGLGGLIPGIIGLIQGIGSDPACVNTTSVTINATTGHNRTDYFITAVYDPPRFSVQVFFFILFGLLCISCLSFTLLHFSPYCKQERLAAPTGASFVDPYTSSTYILDSEKSDPIFILRDSRLEVNEKTPELEYDKTGKKPSVSLDDGSQTTTTTTTTGFMSKGEYAFLLVVTGLVCAILNGIIPATQTYSALPYGNQAYNLAVRLSSIANPLACFLALFIPKRSSVLVGVLTMMALVLTGYQLSLAALSPYPPMKGTPEGEALMITTAVLLVGVISYTRVVAASLLSDAGGHNPLLWCGVATQVGSLIGAVLTFVVVNVLQLLESEYACSTY